jgi:3'-phosphoadenosine 5'-phosphosulfate sulfotransferase
MITFSEVTNILHNNNIIHAVYKEVGCNGYEVLLTRDDIRNVRLDELIDDLAAEDCVVRFT